MTRERRELPYEWKDVRARLQANIDTVLRKLFGAKLDLPAGGGPAFPLNPTRGDKRPGSFVIWREPKSRAGAWKDYACADEGDIFQLIAYVEGLADDRMSYYWRALELLGLPGGPGANTPRTKAQAQLDRERFEREALAAEAKRQEDETAKAGQMKALWLYECQPLVGSLAEVYLREARKVPLDLLPRMPGSLRFHPRMEHRHKETGEITEWPCMVAAITRGSNVTAIHRTFLAPDGSGKAPVFYENGKSAAKMMMGPSRGGAIRLKQRGARPLARQGRGGRRALSADYWRGHRNDPARRVRPARLSRLGRRQPLADGPPRMAGLRQRRRAPGRERRERGRAGRVRESDRTFRAPGPGPDAESRVARDGQGFRRLGESGVRVLVACEFSGTVRDAFSARGHDAWSCDLLPSPDGSNRHIVGDARDHLHEGWDLLMVAHPPCTRLCNSGVRWLSVPPRGKALHQMWAELDEGAALFSAFWNADIERICIENPVMHKHAKARIRNYQEFSQSVQPWEYGHGETKRTCFWLKNLPPLTPTNIVQGREARVHRTPPGPDRWRERSRFFPGIAAAMADQWGGLA